MLTIDLYGRISSNVEFTVLDDEANMLSVMNCATHDSHTVSDKPTEDEGIAWGLPTCFCRRGRSLPNPTGYLEVAFRCPDYVKA